MASAGRRECRYSLLSRTSGSRHDYDHITMLTHPDAVDDHFPTVLEWLQQHNQGAGYGTDLFNQH